MSNFKGDEITFVQWGQSQVSPVFCTKHKEHKHKAKAFEFKISSLGSKKSTLTVQNQIFLNAKVKALRKIRFWTFLPPPAAGMDATATGDFYVSTCF
jgi:hypothetical protein